MNMESISQHVEEAHRTNKKNRNKQILRINDRLENYFAKKTKTKKLAESVLRCNKFRKKYILRSEQLYEIAENYVKQLLKLPEDAPTTTTNPLLEKSEELVQNGIIIKLMAKWYKDKELELEWEERVARQQIRENC